MVILPQKWTSQPQQKIIDSRYLALGLNAVLVVNGNKYYDYLQLGRPITYNAPFLPAAISNGTAVNNNTSYATVRGLSQGNIFSRVAVVKPNFLAGIGTISVGGAFDEASASQWRIRDGEMDFLSSFTANIGTSSGANLQINKTSVVGVTYDGTVVNFYCDGRFVGTASNARTFNQDGFGSIGASLGGEIFNGALGMMLDFNKALSQGDMLALTANPYQVFMQKLGGYAVSVDAPVVNSGRLIGGNLTGGMLIRI